MSFARNEQKYCCRLFLQTYFFLLKEMSFEFFMNLNRIPMGFQFELILKCIQNSDENSTILQLPSAFANPKS